MTDFFERHYLRPILDNTLEVLPARLARLTTTDLKELFVFYTNAECFTGQKLVVERLPDGDYTQELLELIYPAGARGEKLFDNLLAKHTGDKGALYARCVMRDGARYCIAQLRPFYDVSEDVERNVDVWKSLFGSNRMECWEDMLFLHNCLKGWTHQEIIDQTIEELISGPCLLLSDADLVRAVCAFMDHAEDPWGYNFASILIQEYAHTLRPVVWPMVLHLAHTVDLGDPLSSPLKWAVVHESRDVFDAFYPLLTPEQRLGVEEQLIKDDYDLDNWNCWSAAQVRRTLEHQVGDSNVVSAPKKM